ncbi:hypothetical protein [Roseiconus lacunae]|uniref:hypothetical protein n=1 Tax=Roseiconus lacunae TaxID=2605694 RepID=UPI0011F3C583|nr:hypothetical protein [Roseiconus lacunae]
MTQLMLFDTDSLTTAGAPVSPAVLPPKKSQVARSNAQRGNSQVAASSQPISSTESRTATGDFAQSGDDNLHRMGDLARLVLLRYQLVAKRREEMAARRVHRRSEPQRRSQIQPFAQGS